MGCRDCGAGVQAVHTGFPLETNNGEQERSQGRGKRGRWILWGNSETLWGGRDVDVEKAVAC